MDETLSGTSRHKFIFTWVVDLKCVLISRELWSELMQIIFPVLFLLIGVPFPSFGETLDDLVKRNGLYYKISSDIPFNGVIHGQNRGSFKNGSRQFKVSPLDASLIMLFASQTEHTIVTRTLS